MEAMGTLITVVSGLVVIPLSVLTFYLRGTREQQAAGFAELTRRVASVEEACAEMGRAMRGFDRDYTTKEEWLRECMLARQGIERLREISIRLETRLEGLIRERKVPGEAEPRTGIGREMSMMEDQG